MASADRYQEHFGQSGTSYAMLETLCKPPISSDGKSRISISDEDFDDISAILHDLGKIEWSKRPRLYAVLRMIGRITDMDAFISLGHYDNLFPYTSMKSLPDSLRRSLDVSQAFLDHQKFVYTAACDLEKVDGAKHITIKNGDKLFQAYKKKLGEGGAGVVDKVESKMIPGKFYARKRIKRSRDERGKELIAQFQRELGTMKKLYHKHLVSVEASYTDSSYLAILMTPIADCNLKEYLLKPLHPDEVPKFRTYYGCLASAIAYLKQEKIRHSDIKPENILLWNSEILITDFGLAFDWSDSKFSSSITKRSLREATGRYQSPETGLGAPRRSSSDVFSLGVVFLEMTTVLKGETLQRMGHHLETKGTGNSHVSLNLEAAISWFVVIHESLPRRDNIPLQWIKEMINKEPIDRPSAAKLVEQINESTDGVFCGSCCKDCDSECDLSSSSSEGGEFEQPSDEASFVETTRETPPSVTYFAAEDIQDSSTIPSQPSSDSLFGEVIPGAWPDSSYSESYSRIFTNISQTKWMPPKVNKKVSYWRSAPFIRNLSSMLYNQSSSLDCDGSETAGPVLGENRGSKPTLTAMATASSGDRPLDIAEELAARDIKRFMGRVSEENAVTADEQPQLEPDTINIQPSEESFSYYGDYPGCEAKGEISLGLQRNMLRCSKSYDTLQTQPIPTNVNPDISNCLRQSASYDNLFQSWDADYEETKKIWEELVKFGLVERTPKLRSISKFRPLETSPEKTEAVTSNLDDIIRFQERRRDSMMEDEQRRTWYATENVGPIHNEPQNSVTHEQVEHEHRRIWYATEDVGPIHTEPHNFGARDTEVGRSGNESAEWTKKEKKKTASDSGVEISLDKQTTPSLEVIALRPPVPTPTATRVAHHSTESREKKPKKVVAWLAGKIPSSTATASAAAPTLTAANLKAANLRWKIKEPRLVNASVYMESVLNDAASSVPTSVFSARTSNRLKSAGLSLTRVKDSSLNLLETHTKAGNPKEVGILLKHGCNPGTKRKPRWLPIFNAVRGATPKHIKCVRKLIEYGVDVNIRNPSSGKTPLHYAIAHQEWPGYSKLIYILLAAGADPNIKDKLGDVPLLQILYGGDKPLEKHRRDALALLLAPNYTTDVNVSPKGTMNRPLHLAVLRKDPWAVGMLLEKGVKVNEVNGSGLSPLQLAMASWRGGVNEDAEEILVLLLKKKADVNVKDEMTRKTPLHIAVAYALPSHVDLLLEHGARAKVKDKSGKTPIDICAEQRASNPSSAALADISTLFEEYALLKKESRDLG